MRLAAVTMVYDEAEFLPIWLAHYGREVGLEHCFVIDHGSDDGSTEALGRASRVRLPRSAHDDERRAGFVSGFCADLLSYYDAVIHTDSDEIVLADPAVAPSLAAYAAAMPAETITAIGLNVHHLPGIEPDFDLARPVGVQRRWVRFSAALCKPVLTRRPLRWAPGFHCADAPLRFDRLTLFHLRWFDQRLGLRRLARTRAMPWADPAAGAWQRCPDAELIASYAAIAGLPRRETDLAPDAEPLAGALARVRESQRGREGQRYSIDLAISVDELWSVPARFAERF